MEMRKKKIARVFSSFHVSVHVGASGLSAMSEKMDTLACHKAKRIYLNVVSDKSGKYVRVILGVVFECLPSVIMAKM
jgi:hypothetical protein